MVFDFIIVMFGCNRFVQIEVGDKIDFFGDKKKCTILDKYMWWTEVKQLLEVFHLYFDNVKFEQLG